MKRIALILVLAVATVAFVSFAMADNAASAKARPKVATLHGEIVDMGCYLGHGARGEKHQSCAAKCISGGMPMGLITEAGKLYLLTMDHDSPDAFNQCKDLAAKTVDVTGTVMERSGMIAIDVTGVKSATPAAK